MDKVRVLRLISYEGNRDWVEKLLEQSIQGTKTLPEGTIKAGTLGDFPEVLEDMTTRQISSVNEEPNVSGDYVVVVGLITEGLQFVGPFESLEKAIDYTEVSHGASTLIALLENPDES